MSVKFHPWWSSILSVVAAHSSSHPSIGLVLRSTETGVVRMVTGWDAAMRMVKWRRIVDGVGEARRPEQSSPLKVWRRWVSANNVEVGYNDEAGK